MSCTSSSSTTNASPSSTSTVPALCPSLPAASNKLPVKLPPNYGALFATEQAKFLIEKVCHPLCEQDNEKPKNQRVWTLNYISSLLGYEGKNGQQDIDAVLEGRAQNIASRVESLENALVEQHLIDADITTPSATSRSTSTSSAVDSDKFPVNLPPNFRQFPPEEQAKFFIEKVCYPLYERDEETPRSQRVWTLNYISSLLGYEGKHGRQDIAAVLQGRADNIPSRVESLEKALLDQQLVDASAVVPPLLFLDKSYDKAELKQKATILINFCRNELGMSFNEISRPLGFPGNNGRRDIDEIVTGTANSLEARVRALYYFMSRLRCVAPTSMMKFYGSKDRISELFSWVNSARLTGPYPRLFVGTEGEAHFCCLLPADFRGTIRVGVDVALPVLMGQLPGCSLVDEDFAPLCRRGVRIHHPAFSTTDLSIDWKILVGTLQPPRATREVTESLDKILVVIAQVLAPEFGWKPTDAALAQQNSSRFELTHRPHQETSASQHEQPIKPSTRTSDMSWVAQLAKQCGHLVSEDDADDVDILRQNGITDVSRLKRLTEAHLDKMKLSLGFTIALQGVISSITKDASAPGETA